MSMKQRFGLLWARASQAVESNYHYIHSPSKCLARFGLYGVKLPKQK